MTKNETDTTDGAASRISAAAAHGRHTQAIEQASICLAEPGVTLINRARLLDLRLASLHALTDIKEMGDDVQKLSEVAAQLRQTRGDGADEAAARACLWRARLNFHLTGGLGRSAEAAAEATDHARRAGQPELLCACLLQQGQVELRRGRFDAATDFAQQAQAVAVQSGDLAQQSFANAIVYRAHHFARKGHLPEARAALAAALSQAERSASLMAMGFAQIALGASATDSAQAMIATRRAIACYRECGSQRDLAMSIRNLGFTCARLGLFAQARRLYLQNQKGGSVRDQYSAAVGLSNLTEIEVAAGRLEPARVYLEQFRQQMSTLDSEYLRSFLLSDSALVAALAGDHGEAIGYYEEALKVVRRHRFYREHELLAELGRVHLQAGQLAQALDCTQQAVSLHEAAEFTSSDSSGCTDQGIWWTHARALLANDRPEEARLAMGRAYDFLLAGIHALGDVGLRRSYLNKVRDNRELLQFWLASGAQRRLPRQRLQAYLNSEPNAREPLARLADIGQRLTACKGEEEIQTFLIEEATELVGGERVLLFLNDGSRLKLVRSQLPAGESEADIAPAALRFVAAARRTPQVHLAVPSRSGTNRLVAPLTGHTRMLGFLYTEMASVFGRFDEADGALLGMLANQAATALERAELAHTMEARIQARTAQVVERRRRSEQALKLQNADLRDANRSLARQASTDPLTGLLNRRAIEAQYRHMQAGSMPVFVLMLDIDHFKAVNDRHSHAVGDDVLRQVARALGSALRERNSTGRVGGEEFVLLVRLNDASKMEALTERLRLRVQTQNWAALSPGLQVTISGGWTQAQQAEPFEAVLARADQHLYRAKQGGRNQVLGAVAPRPASEEPALQAASARRHPRRR